METRLPTADECRQLAERWPDDFRWPADRLAFDLGFDTYCFLPEGDIPHLGVWHDNDERTVCSIRSFCSIKSFLAALIAKLKEVATSQQLLLSEDFGGIWTLLSVQTAEPVTADAHFDTPWTALLATEAQSDE